MSKPRWSVNSWWLNGKRDIIDFEAEVVDPAKVIAQWAKDPNSQFRPLYWNSGILLALYIRAYATTDGAASVVCWKQVP